MCRRRSAIMEGDRKGIAICWPGQDRDHYVDAARRAAREDAFTLQA